MKLTERAAARIRAIMAEKGAGATGLRIGVKKGGCAGMEYTMDWAGRAEAASTRWSSTTVPGC